MKHAKIFALVCTVCWAHRWPPTNSFSLPHVYHPSLGGRKVTWNDTLSVTGSEQYTTVSVIAASSNRTFSPSTLSVDVGSAIQFEFASPYQPIGGSIAVHPCDDAASQSYDITVYQQQNSTDLKVEVFVHSYEDIFFFFMPNVSNGTCPPGSVLTVRPSTISATGSGAAISVTAPTASWSRKACPSVSQSNTKISGTGDLLPSLVTAYPTTTGSFVVLSTMSRGIPSSGAYSTSAAANTNAAPLVSRACVKTRRSKDAVIRAVVMVWIVWIWLRS